MLGLANLFLSFFITVALLILVHELGHYTFARACKVRVLTFALGLGQPLVQWSNRLGTQFKLGWFPLGGYVKMLNTEEHKLADVDIPFAFDQQSIFKRTLIIAAGPLFNFLFSWLCLWIVLMMGHPKIPPIIAQVIPNSPAAQAGLKPQDKILAINHQRVVDWLSMAHWIRDHPNELIVLKIERQHQHFDRHIRLQNQYGIGFLGLGSPKLDTYPPNTPTIYPAPWSAARDAGVQTLAMIQRNVVGLVQFITGHHDQDTQLEGPISIAKTAQASMHQGIKSYFIFLALVSISLGVINLLPIPILDGGHLLFLMLEALLRRPVSQKMQLWAFQIGASILLSLMILALGHDLFSMR